SQTPYYDDTEGPDYHAPQVRDLELVETDLGRTAREYKESVQEKPLLTGAELLALFEDDVNSPAHYNSGKIEVWDFIYDQGLGYALGNATKYVTRAGK